ncbi:ATPase [Cellulomonas algicola]|uniref:ATPase n=1 Tax=Cellulomonas algicola TaxID=2071633 RepID=A0A401UXC2_9CELL|nr:ATP-binding protein [Cellulomonas algicola]GCD19274.1 ATPase [Cellulomonas algicola]
MDDARNPYTPGAGLKPVELVGRDPQLRAVAVLRERTANQLVGRSVMLHGLRGVGKTVLLREMQNRLEAADWLTVAIEAQSERRAGQQVRRQLERGLVAGARRMQTRAERFSDKLHTALATISSFTVDVGVKLKVDLEPTKGRADSGDLELDLPELVADITPALQAAGIGFAVFADEIQDLDRETLAALLSTQHQAVQQGWPFYLFGAGLPSVPATLADVRPYAERQFEYHSIGQLSKAEAAEAYAGPAARSGARFDTDALSSLVDASAGYPYFVQEFGAHTWRAAAGPEVITVQDAILGRLSGGEALDSGFFLARWERATKSEQRLMQAMALDSGPSAVQDLVSRLGKRKLQDLSVTRSALIAKGLLYAPARGELAFTVPHMATYIMRRDDWSVHG